MGEVNTRNALCRFVACRGRMVSDGQGLEADRRSIKLVRDADMADVTRQRLRSDDGWRDHPYRTEFVIQVSDDGRGCAIWEGNREQHEQVFVV